MATPASRLDLPQLRAGCSRCSLAELCLPHGLSREDIERLDTLVHTSAPLHAGDHLFRVGDAFQAIYAVRSGCFKTYLDDDTGREQVMGFYLPGELMGLGAIYPDRYPLNAVALDTATVCRFPYANLVDLAAQMPSLQHQLLRLMSKDIGGSQALAGDFTAAERLAAFLMSLSRRWQMRGYSAVEFVLSMTRRDIANYLRLATETVSRTLAEFQEDGLIAVERRALRLLKPAELERLCRSVPRI